MYSQNGRILIVGGGAEKNGVNSWSTPAYKWAGEGKRVAIIGISTGSLAPYFKQQCGAAFAKEFAVSNRESANSQSIYDTLITYQTIFFRGGDQYDYYNYYKDTKLIDAVKFVYSNGGTIGGTSAGMHILSSVVYTAKNGSAYPDECIEDPNNKYITLAEDFLDFVPGHLFDTHFAERGRFGRLVGFLANYRLNNGKDIIGLGMDDLTCMTIDGNGLGTVYGTGCANLYFPVGNFSQNSKKLLADSIKIVQLLQGCKYDFKTGETETDNLTRVINTSQLAENGNYTVLASGNKSLGNNIELLDDLLNNTGNKSDAVLILTGEISLAASYKDKLLLSGASTVEVRSIDHNAGTDPGLKQLINSSQKIVLLSNSTTGFIQFLKTENGITLKNKLSNPGMISAFIGDDSRFAGKTVIENFYTEYAGYYAQLTFETGLGLLKNSVIMPNTYFNSIMYENSATAIPYVVSKDTLRYGIWLTDHNYMKFTQSDGKNYIYSYGKAPVMILRNDGGKTGFSSQTSSGSTSSKPRMIAGFDELYLTLTDNTKPYFMGITEPSSILPGDGPQVKVIPNPVNDFFSISWPDDFFNYKIFTLDGRMILKGEAFTGKSIDISSFAKGMYLVEISDKNNLKPSMVKIIKE
ncbi:MAG: T9SS type A sorting domain-containing protein [Saprospiraceae bacterium]|nr:T9SS type A sorting domain-containing protein [Saprospiraceae bacterium]